MTTSWEDIDKAWQNATPAAAGSSGGNFEPIPEGTKVNLVVTDQKPKYVGGNQTPCCKVTFECADEAYADKKVWHDFWITGPNVDYLKRDLGVLGWKGDKLSDLMREEDNSLMALGANVTVGVETYEKVMDSGDTQVRHKNVIKFFNAPFQYVPKGEGQAAPPAKAPPKAPPAGPPKVPPAGSPKAPPAGSPKPPGAPPQGKFKF